MSAAVTLVLPCPPSANRWHTPNGRSLLVTKLAREYTRLVQLAAMMQRVSRVAAPTPIAVEIVWFRAKRAGDVDKRGAVLLDALQGVAYDNDSQIADYRIRRDDSDPAHARVEVTLTPIGA